VGIIGAFFALIFGIIGGLFSLFFGLLHGMLGLAFGLASGIMGLVFGILALGLQLAVIGAIVGGAYWVLRGRGRRSRGELDKGLDREYLMGRIDRDTYLRRAALKRAR
jgi:hypothetical protein